MQLHKETVLGIFSLKSAPFSPVIGVGNRKSKLFPCCPSVKLRRREVPEIEIMRAGPKGGKAGN
ncbi:hypothetical protein LC653_05365 [Nostoc sp. CHAB 5784]|uniref:hypothetical protein n=1 Tax=Nostoc mirabile TaxID=2907820 RepID=UPI001E39865B|nr:hypothetical protein [Nostoc mirabile]MCC5663375.1 hypothetical protein [Nostoc mirabile CHAB5784]